MCGDNKFSKPYLNTINKGEFQIKIIHLHLRIPNVYLIEVNKQGIVLKPF